jgi:catechol 2,3-dioxygenase-like lactoylglutathione lyase family enzyme
MARSELFHVGIVVPDIDTAVAHFTELLGISWGPIVEIDNPFQTAAGEDVTLANFKLCYSTTGPHLELIEEQPGSPWVCNEHSNLHHIGFFSDSLEGSSRKLTGASCPLEIVCHDAESGAMAWWYHRDPLGVRIEFIEQSIMATMNEMMLGDGKIVAPVVVPGI